MGFVKEARPREKIIQPLGPFSKTLGGVRVSVGIPVIEGGDAFMIFLVPLAGRLGMNSRLAHRYIHLRHHVCTRKHFRMKQIEESAMIRIERVDI